MMMETLLLKNKYNIIGLIILSLVFFNISYGQEIKEQEEMQSDTAKFARKINLKEVSVFGSATRSRNNEYIYRSESAKSLVTVLGETDVIRYISTLPGVSQGVEGGLGYFVRGGNSSNNIIELDEVPVYGSTHIFGLFSSFHPDIVKSIDFRTGGIPASSGDFLASIAQISTIQPDRDKYHATLSLSPYMLGISANGYIPNTKIGIVSAARVSLLRPEYLLVKAITKTDTDINPQVADFYLKVNYKIDERNTIISSGYISNDYFGFSFEESDIAMNWGSRFLRLAWDHKVSSTVNIHTFAYFNNFYSGQSQKYYDSEGELSSALSVHSALKEGLFKSSVLINKNQLTLNTGVSAKFRQYLPASEKELVNQANTTFFADTLNTQLYTVFFDLNYKPSERVTANLGLRQSYYSTVNNRLWLTDLRLNAMYQFNEHSGFEMSYDLMSQTNHTLEGLASGWAIDLMVPADNNFRPEISNQIYTGGYWTSSKFMMSAGIYYKYMNNLVRYKNSTNMFGVQNTNWYDEVVIGSGYSYGLELRLEKGGENWNTAFSYTLSKTTRQYAELNNGNPYPFKFDRTHLINLTSQWRVKKELQKEQLLNATVSFLSGHFETLPIAVYEGVELPYWDLIGGNYTNVLMDENSYYRQLMSSVNGYRLPSYFRVDIGYTFKKKKKKYTRELTVGVFNVLNTKNPYLIFYDNFTWKQLSIFPIIPSIQWLIEF